MPPIRPGRPFAGAAPPRRGTTPYRAALLLGVAALLGAAPAAAQRGDPQISMAPHHPTFRNVAQGSYTHSVSTPAYVSLDQPRSATLVYASGQAAPQGFVQFDVTDPSSDRAQAVSAWVTDASGANLTGEVVWHTNPTGGRTQRLALRWDASSKATGAYPVTISVFFHWYTGGHVYRGATATTRVLIVNERGSNYGAGWTLAGHQRLHFRDGSGGAVLTEGDGTAKFFHGWHNDGSYTSPEGDFTTLRYYSASGTNPAYYVRRYPDGTQVLFHADGRMDYSVDRFGNVNKVQYYNNTYTVVFLTDPTNKSLYFAYESTGKLRWIENPGGDGRDTYFSVNAAGNLASVQAADGSYPFRGVYHANHVVDLWHDEAGQEWDLGYNEHRELSRMVAPQVEVTDSGGGVTNVRPYTDMVGPMSAVLPSSTGPCGSSIGSGGCPAPWIAPDEVRLSATDPRGQTTRMAANRYGLPTRVEDPVGRVSLATYNAHGQVEVEQPTGPGGLLRRYHWLGADLKSVVDSLGGQQVGVVYYDYEPVFNQLRTISGTGVTEVMINYDLNDPQRKIESVRVGDYTAPLTTYTYTTRGRVASVTDPGGHRTDIVYESAGAQNTSTITKAPPQVGIPTTTSFRYDAAGRTVAVYAPSGDSVKTQYDLRNRVTHSTNGAGHTTVTAYDARGVATVTDARSKVHSFTRNALGWLTSEKDPLNQVRTYGYDRGGNLTASTNRRGQTVRFAHDAQGRVRTRTADGAVTTYGYDTNLTDSIDWVSAANAESTDTVFSHVDGRKLRQVSVLDGRRFVIASGYQAGGLRNRIDLTAPYARTIEFGYNSTTSEMNQIRDLGGQWASIGPNSESLVGHVTLPNGVRRDFTYSPGHDITKITYTGGSSGPLSEWFSYDGMGRMTARNNPGETVRRQFFYDDAGQVQAELAEEVRYVCRDLKDPSSCSNDWVEIASKSFTYTYDDVGNRTDAGTALQTGTNRLTLFDGYTMSYDADGYMTSKWKHNVDHLTMEWNALGQMTSAWRHNQGTVLYGYNGFGQRVRRTAPNGTVMRYLYEGDDLFMELDAAGNPIREYTYYPGVDQPHSVRSGTQMLYYATDANGNVSGLINSSGGVANRYEYTAWGEPTLTTGTLDQPLRYMAREYDAVTGLYYVRARWYDPAARRFNSEDPIGLAGGINPYVYANNDPVNLRDPYGLFAECRAVKKKIGRIGGIDGFDVYTTIWECGGLFSGMGSGSQDRRECRRGTDGMCELYVPKAQWEALGNRIRRIDGPGEHCAGARQILLALWSAGPDAKGLRFWRGYDFQREFKNDVWTGRYVRDEEGIKTIFGYAANWPEFIAFDGRTAMSSPFLLPHEGIHAWLRSVGSLDASETRVQQLQGTSCRVR